MQEHLSQQEVWDAFLKEWDAFLNEWPIDRLRRMTLPEYSAAGQGRTFTAWIESRLDKMGSIWGGSAFKFGIYSRRSKEAKLSDEGAHSYTEDYAWYSKYGSTSEDAFAKVKGLVVQTAEAAGRADYARIDAIDLGEAYKWKIAYHYQDRKRPGVVAVFKRKRLRAWLKGRVGAIAEETSGLHRQILSLQQVPDVTALMALSQQVWQETAEVAPPDPAADAAEESVDAIADQEPVSDHPLNLILYGPPGTGKTYETAELAVRICDGVIPEGREALMARYRELRGLRRIRFVTFHPSFSYEEFVEGIRPSTENGQVRYDVRPGVFREAVARARELFETAQTPAPALDLAGRRLFKMSLGDTSKSEDDWIYPDCLDNNYVSIGFGSGVDFSGCDTLHAVRDRYATSGPDRDEADFAVIAVHYIKNEIRQGDLILISEGNTRFRAIAEVVGPYAFQAEADRHQHRRPVRWLWRASESVPVDIVFSKRLSQMTIYRMDQSAVKWNALIELLSPKREGGRAPNCVLIIDEINRANMAKTFGELITLLEPSKRLGAQDEQETELPYSGIVLGVPPNLYVIGTMNTADRSIALMDTALRRRFSFREILPRPELLKADVEGINLQALLRAMNARIERLFDRDHVLGHTYLMGVEAFEDLVRTFRQQLIPLLQEYFFEDWRRIQEVFNDVGQPVELQIIQDLDHAEEAPGPTDRRPRFRVNASISPAAIQKIYSREPHS